MGALTAHSRGMLDAPPADMIATYATEWVIPTQDGHIARFSYGLSSTQGWDVRWEIDDRVLIRHCSSWRGVERLYAWLRMEQQQSLVRSTA